MLRHIGSGQIEHPKLKVKLKLKVKVKKKKKVNEESICVTTRINLLDKYNLNEDEIILMRIIHQFSRGRNYLFTLRAMFSYAV